MEKQKFVGYWHTYAEAIEAARKIENPQNVEIYRTALGAVCFCDITVQDEEVFAVMHTYYVADNQPFNFINRHPETFQDEDD